MARAIRLLETAHPATLKIVRKVFDEAWQAIAGNFADAGSARVRLATYVLALASQGERNVAKLRDGATRHGLREEQRDPTKRK